MPRAMVFSGHELTNDIFEANFKAFLGTDISIYSSLAEVKAALENDTDFNLVILVGEGDIAEQGPKIVEFLTKRFPDLRIIAVGFAEPIEGTIELEDRYDIKTLIKTSADILEITAQDMVQKEVSSYFPIPVGLGISVKKAPCPIYWQNGQKFELIGKTGEAIEKKARDLRMKGEKVLFVAAGDRLRFVFESSRSIISKLKQADAPEDEVLEAVSEGQDLIGLQFSESPEVTDEIVQISNACVHALKTTVSKVPSLKALIQALLSNKKNYLYFHGVLTNFVCKHIIDNISWGSKEQYEKLSFVLFFHDMFLVPVFNNHPEFRNEETPLYDESLEDREKDLVLNHAKLAAEIIRTFPQIPIGADTICIQHHGEKNGMGLPSTYREDISPLAKVIIIAESLVEMLLEDYDFEGPIRFEKEKCLKALGQKFAKSSYRKIIETLGSLSV